MREHLSTLKGMASSKAELLRKRLDDLGNVFEFVTIALDRDASPDEGGASMRFGSALRANHVEPTGVASEGDPRTTCCELP